MDMFSQDIICLKDGIDNIKIKSYRIETEGNHVVLYIEEQKESGVGNDENLTHTITFKMADSHVQNFRKILEDSFQHSKKIDDILQWHLADNKAGYIEIRNEGLTTVCVRYGVLGYEIHLDKLIQQQPVTAYFFNGNPIKITRT